MALPQGIVFASDHAMPEGPSETPATDRRRRWSVSAVVVALAALTAAWSGYQAALWSGTQLAESSQQSRLSRMAVEKQLEGDRRYMFDAAHFSAYLDARSSGREQLATFLYDRFGPELKSATDAWLATRPFDSAGGGPQGPLVMPQYHVAAWQEAAEIRQRADERLSASLHATSNADDYVFGTVLFAVVSLLASAATAAGNTRERSWLAGLSALCLVGALTWTLSRPIQLRRSPELATHAPLASPGRSPSATE